MNRGELRYTAEDWAQLRPDFKRRWSQAVWALARKVREERRRRRLEQKASRRKNRK